MRWGDRRGQSTLEYAVLIVIIVAALLGMARYMKRGAMGKLRESTDSLGAQFSPTNFWSSVRLTAKGTTSEVLQSDGEITQTVTKQVEQGREKGEEHVVTGLDQETLW